MPHLTVEGGAESLSSGPSRLQALAGTLWKLKESANTPSAARASTLDQRAMEPQQQRREARARQNVQVTGLHRVLAQGQKQPSGCELPKGKAVDPQKRGERRRR